LIPHQIILFHLLGVIGFINFSEACCCWFWINSIISSLQLIKALLHK